MARASQKKPRNKALTKAGFKTIVVNALTDAENYREQEVGPQRLKAWNYWNGLSDLPAQPNRSKVVMTEVTDTVEQTLPQLMDMFTAGDDPVSFSTERGLEGQKFAWQATQAVNYLFWDKNDGWCLLEDFCRDALVAKTGIFKIYMRPKEEVSEHIFTGLDMEEFAALVSDDEVEILEMNELPPEMDAPPIGDDDPYQAAPPQTPPAPQQAAPAGPPQMPGAPPPPPAGAMMGGSPPQQMGPPTGPGGPPPGGPPPGGPPPGGPQQMAPPPPPPPPPSPIIDCRIRRTNVTPEFYVDCLAPEDFLINRSATSTVKTDYKLIGERRLMMVSDAVEMGIDYDIAVKHAGYEGDDYEEQEREARQERNIYRQDHVHGDPATQTLVIYEIYQRIDKDGDGIAELHKIVAIGDRAAHIHSSEVVADHPYAVGTPIKIPHNVIGKSQADQVTDFQDINTQIMRQVLDNLTHVNNPRKEVVANQVDMNDVKDNRFGGIVKVRAPGSINDITTPFVAGQSMPILEYMDERKEQRTGISKESSALNAESLQSSTETGVRAVLGAAQTQVKMIARTLCETGVKEMYRKLLALVIMHQDDEMMIRVAGEPMKVDPRAWRTVEMDVKVNIGMGAGTREEKLAALQNVAQQQQMILQQYPENPFVLPSHFGYTLHKMTMLAGCGPSERYWKPLRSMDEEAMQLMQKQEQQQGQNPEAEAFKEVEMAKLQAKQQIDQQKMQMDVQADQAKMQADMQADQQKLQVDMQIAQQKGQQQMQLDLMKAKNQMEIEMIKAQMGAQGTMQKAQIDAAVQTRKQEMDAEMKATELALEAQLEKYRIDNDTQIGPANLPSVN